MPRVLLTGAAGFIGFHVGQRLLARGDEVTGIDNLNDYYDVRLKEDRLAILSRDQAFRFIKLDLADRFGTSALFDEGFDSVVHLAAQAGVRYSLTNPHAYVDANLVGFLNVLEGCRNASIGHLVYASSSSVYGSNRHMPFSVHDNVDHPLSLYAATKKANELMAHTYSYLYGLPTTGLRFFTVYGPWGRPYMAAFIFTKAISEGTPIDVFNHGRMERDFTFIDDIADGVLRTLDRIPTGDPSWSGLEPDPATSAAPYRIYNIGNHQPVPLLRLIELIEQQVGRKAIMNMREMQPGDVPATFADVSDLTRDVGFTPSTPIEVGIERFVAWYKEYHADRDAATGRGSGRSVLSSMPDPGTSQGGRP